MIAVGSIYVSSFLNLPKVKIAVDGSILEIRTTAKDNINEILNKAGITIGTSDIVQTNFNGLINNAGVDINIIRGTQKIIKEIEKIPYTVLSRSLMTKNLRPVELIKGYEGIREKIIKVTYLDEEENKRELIEAKENKKIIFKLALKDKKGDTDRIYDLSKSKKIQVTATAYYPGDPMCKPYDGYTTRIGMRLKRGLIAVDPKVIPLRTRLYIPNYGYAYAADTGGMIKGKRIDVCVADAKAAWKFGRQDITVYILE